jgi:hypothetical protein
MRFAVKQLTKTDLTFFDPHHRGLNRNNQKSINLNKDCFVDILYPDIAELIAERGGELETRLRIYGPGLSHDELRVVRKIAKGNAYKNYRLNGENIKAPEQALARFADLVPGDVVLMGFEGVAAPRLIHLVVLSGTEPADVSILAGLSFSPRRTMVMLSAEALADLAADTAAEHPIHQLLLDATAGEDLEAAAQGDAAATARLLKRPAGRKITAEQLTAARRRAMETGLDGERLVRSFLEQPSPQIISWRWTASENAISPYDFEVEGADGVALIEVKTTVGEHSTPFHISMAELETAALDDRYAIWRVSRLGADGGEMRGALGVGKFAREVLGHLSTLPSGLRPDAFTVDPSLLQWGEPLKLAWPESDEP